MPHNLNEAGRTIAAIVESALRRGARQVEVSKTAEDAWIELLLAGPPRFLRRQDCTPGYYNNEGQEPSNDARLYVGYPHGPAAYFAYLERWRSSGDFEGLEFR